MNCAEQRFCERLPLKGTAQQAAGDIRRYQDLGVDHLGVGPLTKDLSESLGRRRSPARSLSTGFWVTGCGSPRRCSRPERTQSAFPRSGWLRQEEAPPGPSAQLLQQ